MKQHLIEFLHPNLFVQVSSAPGNGYRRDNLDKSAVRGWPERFKSPKIIIEQELQLHIPPQRPIALPDGVPEPLKLRLNISTSQLQPSPIHW